MAERKETIKKMMKAQKNRFLKIEKSEEQKQNTNPVKMRIFDYKLKYEFT